MKKFFISILLSASLALSCASALAKPFSNLVIFGGSLADSGNFASATGGLPEPYYQGRFSNGPVASDVIAAAFGFEAKASEHLIGPPVGNNFAMHGALASRSGPFDLNAQLDAYLTSTGNIADPDTLYLLLIGGNDVFEATFATDNDADADQIVRDAIKGTEAAFERLVAAGAKTILAANFFDLGIIPLAKTKGLDAKASRLSALFNRLTKSLFNRVEHKLGIQLIRFDFDQAVDVLLNNADELHFTNYTDSCLALYESGECDFEHFAFFNEYLPTARIHTFLGQAMTFAVLQRNNKQ